MTRPARGAIGRRKASTAIAGALLLPAWVRAQASAPAASAAASAAAPQQAGAPPPFTIRDARALGMGAVKMVKDAEKVDLDFSPASLEKIDDIVLRMRDENTPVAGAVVQVLLVLGCYVGEVLVRNTGGLWVDPGPDEQRLGVTFPGVRMRNGAFFNPIGKVFRLMENGSQDSVAFFYAVVKGEDAKTP